MEITSTYSVRLHNFNRVFDDTVEVYRNAVDFFIELTMTHWKSHFANLSQANDCIRVAESLSVRTIKRPMTTYNFCQDFEKFPCYLRRAAIKTAYGQVSSYQTRLAQWKAKQGQKGRQPGLSRASRIFPVMYRDNTFVRTGRNCVQLKVRIRNTWDWVDVALDKHDVNYIALHCATRKELCPALRKRGKKWYLDFSFSEMVTLDKVSLDTQLVLGVDLGINNACVCSVMDSKGTIIGRRFLKLSKEQDSLERALQHIKKAQSNGATHMPGLWARANGVNEDISVKTANFIVEVANEFKVDVIVMEHLDLSSRKRGSRRQRLHHWRAKYVQQMVEYKAHRCGIRFRRVCAWNTSKLAFDGTGVVTRDPDNYSMCTFKTGKRYSCDLSASYNIGARYFLREYEKSISVTKWRHITAKVPECAKRITRTLDTLTRVCAELRSL